MISDAEINALEAWYLHCADTQENPNGGRILALIKRLRDAEKERDALNDQLNDRTIEASTVDRNAIIEQCAKVCDEKAASIDPSGSQTSHSAWRVCNYLSSRIRALKDTP